MLEFNLSKEKYELPQQMSQVFSSSNVKGSVIIGKMSVENMPKSI
jgi:hypothetical protein